LPALGMQDVSSHDRNADFAQSVVKGAWSISGVCLALEGTK
jgi:hypothetical protein